jgi:hypothetical protein
MAKASAQLSIEEPFARSINTPVGNSFNAHACARVPGSDHYFSADAGVPGRRRRQRATEPSVLAPETCPEAPRLRAPPTSNNES